MTCLLATSEKIGGFAVRGMFSGQLAQPRPSGNQPARRQLAFSLTEVGSKAFAAQSNNRKRPSRRSREPRTMRAARSSEADASRPLHQGVRFRWRVGQGRIALARSQFYQFYFVKNIY